MIITNIKASIKEGKFIVLNPEAFTGLSFPDVVEGQFIFGNEAKGITLANITNVVSDMFDIPQEIMYSKQRNRDVTLARNIIATLARKYTQRSLRSIGFTMGRRDHSTISHAIQSLQFDLDTHQMWREKKISIWIYEIECKLAEGK